MSERYFITGAQIGSIKGILSPRVNPRYIIEEINKFMDEIMDKQFVGNIQKGDKVVIKKEEEHEKNSFNC